MLRSAIPPGFSSRKSKILANLSLPDAEYTDLSPKGSVDEGIRDLIRDINAIDGLVTTSSCAGRVSVFVEGRKKRRRTSKKPKEEDIVSVATSEYSGADETDSQRVDASQNPEGGREFAVSGGKGDGHWLYVSHDPVNLKELDKTSFHELFGLLPGDGKPAMKTADESGSGIRLVRFHFEPMVRVIVVHISINPICTGQDTPFHISCSQLSLAKTFLKSTNPQIPGSKMKGS
jgi:tRNA wybutosine-synthesizing protein 3